MAPSPANSPPVRVDTTPGAFWRYSGGGYTVMQLMMDDVTGVPFDQWMATNVIGPFGMSQSSFQQPPSAAMAPFVAAGQYAPGTPVPGRYHLYPEMAAAGLWTTASDLGRFVIAIQQSYAGTANPVISQAMTREMLTDVKNNDGLGVFLDESSGKLLFFHGGRDDGFDAYMGGYAETGQGVVIMINANDNSGMMRRIYEFVAREYGWPGSAPQFALTPVRVPSARLVSYGGRYEAANNQMVTLVPQGDKLVSMTDGLPDRVFVPTGEWQVTSEDQVAPVHLRARCGRRHRGLLALHQRQGCHGAEGEPAAEGCEAPARSRSGADGPRGSGAPRPGRGRPGDRAVGHASPPPPRPISADDHRMC